MAASVTRRQLATRSGEGLYPTRLSRDLYQIAELIELCFGERLDAGGRTAVREMKAVGRLGPLLVLADALDRVGLGLGSGYVWRVDRRVIGNVSLYHAGTHPDLGRGWLIANVAVHPNYRRRGIARALMEAVLDLARSRHGRWAVLQVEADNGSAISLYETLGFERFETLIQWEAPELPGPLQPPEAAVRLRRPGEVRAEINLVYRQARRGAMAWTRSIEPSDIQPGWESVGGWLGGTYRQHWQLRDPSQRGGLDGALWVELSGWRQARLTLFLDPALADRGKRQALLWHVFSLPEIRWRQLRVETCAGDEAVEDVLFRAGFAPVRSLLTMRRMLTANQPDRRASL